MGFDSNRAHRKLEHANIPLRVFYWYSSDEMEGTQEQTGFFRHMMLT